MKSFNKIYSNIPVISEYELLKRKEKTKSVNFDKFEPTLPPVKIKTQKNKYSDDEDDDENKIVYSTKLQNFILKKEKKKNIVDNECLHKDEIKRVEKLSIENERLMKNKFRGIKSLEEIEKDEQEKKANEALKELKIQEELKKIEILKQAQQQKLEAKQKKFNNVISNIVSYENIDQNINHLKIKEEFINKNKTPFNQKSQSTDFDFEFKIEPPIKKNVDKVVKEFKSKTKEILEENIKKSTSPILFNNNTLNQTELRKKEVNLKEPEVLIIKNLIKKTELTEKQKILISKFKKQNEVVEKTEQILNIKINDEKTNELDFCFEVLENKNLELKSSKTTEVTENFLKNNKLKLDETLIIRNDNIDKALKNMKKNEPQGLENLSLNILSEYLKEKKDKNLDIEQVKTSYNEFVIKKQMEDKKSKLVNTNEVECNSFQLFEAKNEENQMITKVPDVNSFKQVKPILGNNEYKDQIDYKLNPKLQNIKEKEKQEEANKRKEHLSLIKQKQKEKEVKKQSSIYNEEIKNKKIDENFLNNKVNLLIEIKNQVKSEENQILNDDLKRHYFIHKAKSQLGDVKLSYEEMKMLVKEVDDSYDKSLDLQSCGYLDTDHNNNNTYGLNDSIKDDWN